jgi:phenylacetate-CoA ligase
MTRVYLSRKELYAKAGRGQLLCDLMGLTEHDRLLCTLDLAFGLGSVLVDSWVRDLPLFAMVVGRVDPLDAYRRIQDYGFNVIVSDPFWLGRLTEIAREHGHNGGLKLMIGGGEGVTRENRARLEEFWRAPLCMTYASTESATALGFECRYQTGYHVNNYDFYMEIDDPDEDGYGELVLTTLSRKVMPLIRYRTGDVARWLSGPCACGFPFRRLALRGRVDEQVSCAWGNLHPEFFEKLMSAVPGSSDEWQVAVTESAGKQVIQFRMELESDAQEEGVVSQSVLEALRQQSLSAWHAYEGGLIDVDFRFHQKGQLRTKRKLMRLVDERDYT